MKVVSSLLIIAAMLSALRYRTALGEIYHCSCSAEQRNHHRGGTERTGNSRALPRRDEATLLFDPTHIECSLRVFSVPSAAWKLRPAMTRGTASRMPELASGPCSDGAYNFPRRSTPIDCLWQ